MVENLAEIIDRLEQRSVYSLAGLEPPDAGTTYKFNAQTGKSELFRKPPELPPARELLAQLLQEGHSARERCVAVARDAVLAERLLAQPTKGRE